MKRLTVNWRRHLVDARRLAVWRPPLFDAEPLPAGSILAIFAVSAAVQIATQLVHSYGLASFSIYGVNTVLALESVFAAIVIVFARVDPTSSTLRNLVLLYATGAVIGLAAAQALWAMAPATESPKVLPAIGIPVLLIGSVIWTAGAARQVFRRVRTVRHPLLRAIAYTVCLHLVAVAFPYWPVFAPISFQVTTANAWEAVRSVRDRATSAQREEYEAEARRSNERAALIEAQQPARLDAALAAIEPRDPEKPNIFLVGLSGWSGQDVFEKETDQSLQILKSRFGIGNRIVRLINADATVARDPIASIQNLGGVLRGLGKRMDRERDVLVLTMTSHGSPDGFALSFGGLVYRSLAPTTLKLLLDEAGIKNRVLIVAACYSGVFVPVLADDDTMIITGASSSRTSFGCASGRKWTYFGDAFFNYGLRRGKTLAEAFAIARRTVAAWETKWKLTPSEPQIYIGRGLARRFPALVGEPQQQAMLPVATPSSQRP